MSNIKVDYDILNQKQTPAFYASSLATRPAFGFPGRIFIDTDTPSSGIYRDTGSAWVQVADPGAGTTGTLQQVTTNGNTTTLGVTIQGIDINDGAGTGVSNTAIGLAALQLNTTGAYNTAIGYGTLQANTTGGNNVATGYYSLFANTTGVNNVAIGYGTLQANTTGSANTSVGYLSLSANTTAGSNTAIGHEALRNNTTGAQNTAVGHQSLRINTTGQYNVSVGQDSLANNIIGSNNTAIGQGSLRNNTADGNVAVGYLSSNVNTTGVNNSSLGISSLRLNTTGSNNTAIGSVALQNNTTADNNTAVGYGSLANNTGANNTAVGVSTLGGNTSGIENTAVGLASLNANTTGQYNSGFGRSSLNANTTGNYNTAIGSQALANISTGSQNIAIGYNCGLGITTGSFNTIIGTNVTGLSATLSNNIILADGAGNVRLFSNDTGKVGINVPITDTPTGQVDIHTSLTNALVLNGNTTNNAYLGFASAGVNKWRIGNTYNAGANTFDIFNLGTSTTALSFNSTTNAATFNSSITPGGIIYGINGNLDPTIGTNAGTTLTYNGFSATNNYSTGLAAIRNSAYDMFFQTGATNGGGYRFYIGTSEKMTMSNTGNVGIGTSSPSAGLEVVTDSGAFNALRLVSNRAPSSGTDVAVAFRYLYDTTNYATGGLIVAAKDNTTSGSQSGNMQFYTNNAGTVAERMRITSGGNVLIGTSTDDTTNKLQVNGNIAINKGASTTAIFDTNGSTISLATGGTADFTNFSGMLLVNNYNTGAFQIFVCGAGNTASVYLLGGAMGTFLYNIGINGYTFTSTSATATFNFTAFRTRNNA